MAADPFLGSLIRRVDEEGPVFALPDGTVGIFDPVLALEIEVANSKGLKLPGSLSSPGRDGGSADEVTWSEARALLIQRSRQLSAPAHLKGLHARMRRVLLAESGRAQDFTPVVVRALSEAILPLIIDGLHRRGAQKLAAEQRANFSRIWSPPATRPGLARRVADVLREVGVGRAISRHLARRAAGKEPARDDYAQAIVPLVSRVGVTRAAYLVTTLLAAAASPPGLVASCILYELVRNAEWRERLRAELGALEPGELSAAAGNAPATRRFIREAMRLWVFPLVAHRIAYRDLEVAGAAIRARCPYDLSPYVMHHSERYWTDPERFDPDRWLATDALPASAAYVPFGFGPRSCVGALVGQAQLLLFCRLATCEFDFELAGGAKPRIALEGFALPADFRGTVRPRA
ncbi:MAG TPA: cytochrome P450 [Allosphingosinicella sp.]|jgi:cytochrome P450